MNCTLKIAVFVLLLGVGSVRAEMIYSIGPFSTDQNQTGFNASMNVEPGVIYTWRILWPVDSTPNSKIPVNFNFQTPSPVIVHIGNSGGIDLHVYNGAGGVNAFSGLWFSVSFAQQTPLRLVVQFPRDVIANFEKGGIRGIRIVLEAWSSKGNLIKSQEDEVTVASMRDMKPQIAPSFMPWPGIKQGL